MPSIRRGSNFVFFAALYRLKHFFLKLWPLLYKRAKLDLRSTKTYCFIGGEWYGLVVFTLVCQSGGPHLKALNFHSSFVKSAKMGFSADLKMVASLAKRQWRLKQDLKDQPCMCKCMMHDQNLFLLKVHPGGTLFNIGKNSILTTQFSYGILVTYIDGCRGVDSQGGQ